MATLTIIGGITLLLLVIFQQNQAKTQKQDEYQDFFGQPVYYPRTKKKKVEKPEPFIGVAYAIFFVLGIFAFLQMQQQRLGTSVSKEDSRQNENETVYESSEDYKSVHKKDDVLVIRP